MAYVAISHGLVDETRSNIRGMRDKELTSLTQPPSAVDFPADHAVPMDLAWGKFAAQRSEFPEDWKTMVSHLNLRMVFMHNEKQIDYSLTIRPTSGKFEVPHLNKNHYDSVTYRVDADHPLATTIGSTSMQYAIQAADVNAKWEAITKQVTDFLRASKSLNEALKLWPALALYVSKSYIDRVNNNAKREAKVSDAATLLASIDTDSITAAAVSAKLTV